MRSLLSEPIRFLPPSTPTPIITLAENITTLLIFTLNDLCQLRPWNVDTISTEGFSKTKINKPVPRKQEDLSEEEREKRMKEFVKKNETDLKVICD